MNKRVSDEALDGMIEAVPQWYARMPRTTREEIADRTKCLVAAEFLLSALEELKERRKEDRDA